MNGGSLYFDNTINDIFIAENGTLIDIENVYKSLDNVLNQLQYIVNNLNIASNFPKSKFKSIFMKVKKYVQSISSKRTKISEFIFGKDFYSFFISTDFDYKFNNHEIMDVKEINSHLLDYKINEVINFVKERMDIFFSRVSKYYKSKLSTELYNFNKDEQELYDANLILLRNKIYMINKKLRKVT
tara:strand:- start:248 stop:802 length:555 start_codon:yes stop_codon:yes gene_type:complete